MAEGGVAAVVGVAVAVSAGRAAVGAVAVFAGTVAKLVVAAGAIHGGGRAVAALVALVAGVSAASIQADPSMLAL